MNINCSWQKLLSICRNSTIRNGALFSFFSFLNSGISFLLLIIIAKFITPEGYGKLNIFNTTVMLLGFLIHLNTQGVISINFFSKSRIEFSRTINAVFLITIVCLFLYGILLVVLGDYLTRYLDIPVSLLLIALFICFFQLFSNVNLDLWRLEEKPVLYGLYSSSNVIGNFILTLILIIGWDCGWLGRVYSHFFIASIFLVLSVFFMIRRGYLVAILPSANEIKDALSFGVPLIPHSTSFWLRQGLDRYIINACYNTSLVGLFSFSYNFANIIQIIGTAFNATNSVFIYKNLSKEDGSSNDVRMKLKKQTKWMMIFYIGITAAICIMSSLFIVLFFPQYIGSLDFIIPQCLGAMCQCFYLLFVNYLFFYKKTKKLMYITTGFSVLHAVLSLVLTQYSIYYTVYIGFLSNFLIAVSVYVYSRSVYKIF